MSDTEPVGAGSMGDHPRLNAPLLPDGRPYFRGFDPSAVPTPCFVVDRAAVAFNTAVLRDVADRAEASMLLALKAFALPAVFDLIRGRLDGVCASGVYEARLGREEIASAHPDGCRGRSFEVHTYSPAYDQDTLAAVAALSDHISFNSPAQWVRLRHVVDQARRRPHVGLRLNPEYSAAPAELYDPSARRSRLGITATEFAWGLDGLRVSPEAALDGVSGLHIHTLCEAGAQALADTLSAVERRFPSLLARPEITWFNAGGGHHITKPDYDRELLIKTIRAFAARHGVRVILEPGEAAAIHAGVLVARVVDLTCNEIPIAVLDTSATTHMPDTIEMPYRPDVWGAAPAGRLPYTYRLGGQTCLAGDIMGEYSFAQPLRIGDHVVFDDMSHYTMVKTTTFNGVPLPSIATWDSDRTELVVHRRPRYSDFRAPLG